MRRAKRSLVQATKHSRQIDPSAGRGHIQHAESADDFQVARACRRRTVTFVHQEQCGMLFHCEKDGISLTGIQMGERRIGRRLELHNV